MEIEEYTDPINFDAEYAPRPRAEQQAARAAAKRARAEADGDTPAPIAQPKAVQLAVGVLGVLAVVGVLALALFQPAPRPLVTPAAPTSAPQAQEAASAPFSGPTPAQPTEIAHIRVYAAPDGAQLGPVEVARAMTPVAHYGSDWIQAEVAGSGLVWIRASDMPSLAIVGPDLAPQDAPAPAPPQTGRGLGVQYVAPVIEELAPNGSKAAPADDWCRGAHLDDPACAGERGTK